MASHGWQVRQSPKLPGREHQLPLPAVQQQQVLLQFERIVFPSGIMLITVFEKPWTQAPCRCVCHPVYALLNQQSIPRFVQVIVIQVAVHIVEG